MVWRLKKALGISPLDCYKNVVSSSGRRPSAADSIASAEVGYKHMDVGFYFVFRFDTSICLLFPQVQFAFLKKKMFLPPALSGLSSHNFH